MDVWLNNRFPHKDLQHPIEIIKNWLPGVQGMKQKLWAGIRFQQQRKINRDKRRTQKLHWNYPQIMERKGM